MQKTLCSRRFAKAGSGNTNVLATRPLGLAMPLGPGKSYGEDIMKKMLIAGLLIALAPVLPHASVLTTNLITNPGAEAGDLSGWTAAAPDAQHR